MIIKTDKVLSGGYNYKVRLTDRDDGQNIPKNMDIASIKLHNVNLNIIDKVSIDIGGMEILSFVGDEINNIVLPDEGILSSKCIYHTIDIIFHFNKKYIDDNSTFVWEDEYVEEEIETDEIVCVRNPETGDVYHTNVIKLVKKQTGKKIKIITKPVTIEIPDIELTFKPEFKTSETWIVTPIYQKILVDPKKWKTVEQLSKYQANTIDDEMTIEENFENGEPFHVKIRNELKYCNNLAGLAYAF
jgi:hypothetical protein